MGIAADMAFAAEAQDLTDAWLRYETLSAQYADASAELAVRLETDGAMYLAWSCTLRYTPKPNRAHAPDVSLVFYASAGTPGEALAQALDELEHERCSHAVDAVERTHHGMPTWHDVHDVTP